MTRKVGDDVSTNEVVWAAAERIGKSSNAQDVNRICEYLIGKHWFQTAGDLRVARENAQEWLALEVPGRLKIAIQEVLDAQHEATYSPGKTHIQSRPDQPADDLALGIPSHAAQEPDESQIATVSCFANPSIVEIPAQSIAEYAFYGQESSEPVQGTGYDLTTTDASTTAVSNYNEAHCSVARDDSSHRSESQDDAAAAAAHAAAWEAYYAANGYYSYGTAEQATSGSWDYGSFTTNTQPSEDVVEAQEVVVEEAIAVESQLLTGCDEGQSEPPFETSEAVRAQQPETWSCGQCTYINRIDISFCDVCYGHYSLADETQLPPPAVSTLSENKPAEVSPDVIVVDLQDSYSPSPEIAQSTFYQDPVVDTTEQPTDVALSTRGIHPVQPHGLELPLYVTIPSPSKPSSPLYTPSAPDFEEPAIPPDHSSKAQDFTLHSGKEAEISAPTPIGVAAPSLSPPKVDYRALAFKRTPSILSASNLTARATSDLSSPPRSGTEVAL